MKEETKEISMKKKVKSKKQLLQERQKKCKHKRIEEIQGGQIERCRDCGKEWGG